MTLRQVIAAAFKHHGQDAITRTQFVAAIALERGWYTPEEVRQIIEHAITMGELDIEGETIRPRFDVGSVTIPSGFDPPGEMVDPHAPFERLLERLEAEGHPRQETVASINRLQSTLGVTSDGAALVYAHTCGLNVHAETRHVRHVIENNNEHGG